MKRFDSMFTVVFMNMKCFDFHIEQSIEVFFIIKL